MIIPADRGGRPRCGGGYPNLSGRLSLGSEVRARFCPQVATVPPTPERSMLGWTAPAASMCQAEVVADLREGGHPWTTLSELVWPRRRTFSSSTRGTRLKRQHTARTAE